MMKKPKVYLNAAMTLDGKIALSDGSRLRISSQEDKARVHRLRGNCDAIMVGVNTILKDNPKLYVNPRYAKKETEPYRVVLDSHLRTPKTSKIISPLNDGRWPATIIFTSPKAKDVRYNLRTSIERVSMGADGLLNLEKVLDVLYRKYKIRRLLVEGGATVLKSFILSNLFDEFTLYIGPMMVGDGPTLIQGWECFSPDDVSRFKIKSATKLGEGIMLVLGKP